MPCDVDTRGGGVGERVSDAASVADDVESLMAGFEIFVDLDLHIIELDLDTVEESVLVRRTGGYLIKRLDHLDDSVEDSLRKDEREVAGGRLEGGCDEGFLNAAFGRALAVDEIAVALHDNAAAEHIT